MRWKWLAAGVGGLLILIAAVLGGAAYWALHTNLAAYAARYASGKAAREVKIGGLRLGWNGALTIDLRDVSMANIDGGTRPLMLTLDRLTGNLEPLSLLNGPPVVRGATIDGLSLLLERTADERANWKLGKLTPEQQRTSVRGEQKNLSGFPALLGLTMHRADFAVRTSSGRVLDTKLDEVAVRAATVDQPVLLNAAGTYNGVPVKLDATLGTIAQLRRTPQPFPADIHVASENTVLTFKGTFTDPANIEGADGVASLSAPVLTNLFQLGGMESQGNLSLTMDSHLTRKSDVWRFPDAHGSLGGDDFTLDLTLAEGGRGQPDDITYQLAFDNLDLGVVSDSTSDTKSKGKSADTPLSVDPAPGALLDGTVTAKRVRYERIQGTDFTLKLKLTREAVTVNELSMLLAGARVQAAGDMQPAGQGAKLSFHATAQGGDIRDMLRAFGSAASVIDGPYTANADVAMTGKTLGAALKTTGASVVVGMRRGTLSANVIELASTDVRRLFRKPKGASAINCLLGIVRVDGGIGSVAPLRIRTSDGTIAGAGSFNLRNDTVDLTVGSDRSTTGFLALDVPVRVTGRLSDPNVTPARGDPRLFGRDNLARLTPAQQDVVRRDPCYSAR